MLFYHAVVPLKKKGLFWAIGCILACALLIQYGTVYYAIGTCKRHRDAIVEDAVAAGAETIFIPGYPYCEYIWLPDPEVRETFFKDFYPLMNKSKNNLIEFANGKYYVMGCEVYFTGSLSTGVAYLGDFAYIVGNYSQDITVVKSEHSGLSTNSVHYLGSCVFDSKAVPGMGAFVKLAKKAA